MRKSPFRIQASLIGGLLVAALALYLLWPASQLETDIFIPVEIVNLPQGLTITDFTVKGVEASIKGTARALNKVENDRARCLLDLTGKTVGAFNIPVRPEDIQISHEVAITQIDPSFLTGKLVEIQQKRVPVKIKLEGKPAPGFEITSITAKPEKVVLEGAPQNIDPIECITTKPIEVNGHSETFQSETALDQSTHNNLSLEPSVIQAEIVVREQTVTKKFKGIAVEGKNCAYPFHISPPKLDIEVKGPVNALQKLDLGRDLQLYVDLNGLKPGVYVRRAVIALPVRLTLVHVEPEVFTVKIDHKNNNL